MDRLRKDFIESGGGRFAFLEDLPRGFIEIENRQRTGAEEYRSDSRVGD